MSTDDKFTRQLESMERQFRDRLLGLLPRAAKTGSAVFTNTTFNPHNLPPHLLGTDADELLEEAQACLRLREQLDLPVTGSVGYVFIGACQEAANIDTPNVAARADWPRQCWKPCPRCPEHSVPFRHPPPSSARPTSLSRGAQRRPPINSPIAATEGPLTAQVAWTPKCRSSLPARNHRGHRR